MALPLSFDVRCPTFSGPYSRLLGVRSEGWSKRYGECMSTSTEAQDDLENIEASVGDLIHVSSVKKAKVQMAKSWDFGPSLMTEDAIKALEYEGYFLAGKGHPPRGEIVPQPEVDEVVVFKDFFACGIRIPPVYFSTWFSRLLRYSSIILLLMGFLH